MHHSATSRQPGGAGVGRNFNFQRIQYSTGNAAGISQASLKCSRSQGKSAPKWGISQKRLTKNAPHANKQSGSRQGR